MLVTIRPAKRSEADALTVLALEGKRHWQYPESWLEAWRGVLSITPDYIAAHIVFCAEDEPGRMLGFYALEHDGDCVRLEHLWLAPSLIGQGLGRQLFHHAVQTAQNLGAKELLIEADPNAEGFYLHMGAQRIGAIVSRVTGTERILRELVYRLRETTVAECATARKQAFSDRG